MTLRYFPTIVFVLFLSTLKAQSTKDEALFTVDKEPVTTSEFIRVYNKNLDLVQDESQKKVDEYLELFINYKLKLKEARALQYHKKLSYINELDSYKKQLSKNYVTDGKVTDALIEEAYNRIANEVKATHILVRLEETANPEDTLKAYNEIVKLKDRALKEGFESVRAQVHNGQTIFGEELGYFSGFKMVYKFENVAYNTPVGEISDPFRTRFGYHIIHVLDKRPSRGERTVAHIMITNAQTDTLNVKPEVRIQEINQKLNQGEDFEVLAKQFSDDKSSAPKGGMLAPFTGGQLSVPEFEEISFGLKNVGDVSQPFQTKYGWHIVKLYDKTPLASFIDLKPELEVKVKRDERSKLIDKALISKLKAKYNITSKPSALDYFVSILNEDYNKRTWMLPSEFEANMSLVKIGNKQFTFKDFGDYLVKSQRSVNAKQSFKTIVSTNYESFLNESLIQYQEDNLESENEEFAHIVSEYRDGLLLFDLMESTIWNTAKTDSLDIENFFTNNKDNYIMPKRIDAIVASSTKQKTLKKVAQLLGQNLGIDQIKSLVNSNDDVQVIFTTGIMDESHQAIPDKFKFVKGISEIYKHNNGYIVAQVNDVLPQRYKTLEEAKGMVISDYQAFKEKKWLEELREKYEVVVNQDVLTKVKLKIKNQ